MNEQREEQVEKPDSKKLDHAMSMAPFMGPGKIEYNDTYKEFEKTMLKQEKNKDLNWMNFFELEDEIEKLLEVGALVVIETKKFRALFTNKPGYEARKFRPGGEDYQTTFFTWQEIINIIKLWKDGKFNSDLIVNPETYCINRNFRHVHIFKHKSGYLFANQFDMTYPKRIMDACILLNK